MFVSSSGGRETLSTPVYRRRLRPAACALALSALVGACDFGTQPDDPRPGRSPLPSPTGADTHVVALVGSISGPDSWRGEDALEGADLAVGLLNRSLEPNDRRFELLSLDDESDPRRARAFVQRAANLDQTVGVIYAGPTEALPALEDVLAEAGIPALALFGDLYGARRLSPHLFQVGASYVWEARRLAAYFSRDRGYRRIGALVSRSLDGGTAAGSLRAALRGAGTRLRVERYEGSDELRAKLTALQRFRAEGVVIEGDPGAFEAALAELDDMGAAYTTREAARAPRTRKERRRYTSADWSPQVGGLDVAIAPGIEAPTGTVAADSYARGAHYLPVPSLRAFRDAFVNWWDEPPLGFERRAFEATTALGAAVRRAEEGTDLARALERVRGRFGGLDVTLGPDDHTFVTGSTVGLWVVPRTSTPESEDLPETLPWVPLARGFAIDRETLDIPGKDWRYLVRGAPPPKAPAPDFDKLRFGVTSGRKDPVH